MDFIYGLIIGLIIGAIGITMIIRNNKKRFDSLNATITQKATTSQK